MPGDLLELAEKLREENARLKELLATRGLTKWAAKVTALETELRQLKGHEAALNRGVPLALLKLSKDPRLADRQVVADELRALALDMVTVGPNAPRVGPIEAASMVRAAVRHADRTDPRPRPAMIGAAAAVEASAETKNWIEDASDGAGVIATIGKEGSASPAATTAPELGVRLRPSNVTAGAVTICNDPHCGVHPLHAKLPTRSES